MSNNKTPTLQLKGFQFSELMEIPGLCKLDLAFLDYLKNINSTLYEHLLLYRENQLKLTPILLSEFLLALAPLLEAFIIDLFDIEEAAGIAQNKTLAHNPISAFKKFYVLRQAKKKLLNKTPSDERFTQLNIWLDEQLKNFPLQTADKELAISLLGNAYLADPTQYQTEIQQLTDWCIECLLNDHAKPMTAHWTIFKIPQKLDYTDLVPHQTIKGENYSRLMAAEEMLRHRDGFQLTDPRYSAREAQDEVNYCIYCHDHDGDFCSKGFPVKKGDPSQGFKKNPLDVTLTGCPLEEKISEMHLLKRDGQTIAALAMIMVDNPMCPATGHRICNDCMKACIYQKQEPVNIPQTETRILTDVLDLPWGVEIYDLLTRWNPLRQKQYLVQPYNGLKVLIAGMGPAGFTLAHHLLMEGFAVVGFDGLKIEPLAESLIRNPIYSFTDLKESLDERLMAGFGGVAEYGITVRWDKNFLKLIYLTLLRRPLFQVFGSIRFGGTITVEDAWEMGFDHFVIAVGAGLPKALPIPGSLAPGMRQANDFLMALQLGNAAKKESLTNIQVRLPAVIIGGGLTGVDTATEVQAYYITQVEKTLARYEQLTASYGESYVTEGLDPASLEILEEYLTHGKAIRQERKNALANHRKPNFIHLIHQWGGVTIVYRRRMQDSPAYINNHEELTKALQEGVLYIESMEPTRVELNAFGHAETLICHKRLNKKDNEWESTTEEIRLPARAIFVATGTQPNIAYEFEHRGTFIRQGFHYQHYEEVEGELLVTHGITHNKEHDFGPFTSYQKGDYRVSLIGDTHPVFHGNVVKAIASGMRTYPKILAILKDKFNSNANLHEHADFAKKIKSLFHTFVTRIERRTPHILELTLHAPLAVKKFQPGQFFRLQNYETFAPKVGQTQLQIEPLALVGMHANKQTHELTFMIIEKGASAKICKTFKVKEPLSLMGPTGIRAKVTHHHQTVLVIGNVLSLPLVQSYGKALKAQANRVIYLGHLSPEELYCQDKIEESTDLAIWCTRTPQLIQKQRPEDYTTNKAPLAALLDYGQGQLDPKRLKPEIPLADIDRIYVIGDTCLLKDFQQARQNLLKPFLVKEPLVYGSVYSTMQCMLKGVCAQCLQWQIDPETGKRTKAVFACSWPEQPLELIDFHNIEERQIQNRLQEHLSNLWVDYLFENYLISHI